MSNKPGDDNTADGTSTLAQLNKSLDPPPCLEERVVAALQQQALLRPARSGTHFSWLTVRAALVAAACMAILAVGILIGRNTVGGLDAALAALIGNETDLYAVMLYETTGYDVNGPDADRALFEEYNQWVALARGQGQFVTGEDLEITRGWLVSQSANEPRVEPATALAESAPLSGIFFLRTDNEDELLALVAELPHIKHGGQVLVQKTIPTN